MGTAARSAAGVDAGAGSFAAPFDARGYAGISFYVRAPGATTPVKVNFQLSDRSTHPAGGVCDQCLYGGPAVDSTTIRCGDDWVKTLAFPSAWTQVTVRFNDPLLKTEGWSTNNMPRPSSAIDLKSLYYVHLQISTSNYAAPVKPFHIQVAFVSFIAN